MRLISVPFYSHQSASVPPVNPHFDRSLPDISRFIGTHGNYIKNNDLVTRTYLKTCERRQDKAKMGEKT